MPLAKLGGKNKKQYQKGAATAMLGTMMEGGGGDVCGWVGEGSRVGGSGEAADVWLRCQQSARWRVVGVESLMLGF